MLNIIRCQLGEDTFNLNPCWIIEKAKGFQKNNYFCFIDYIPAFVSITTNWKILKKMGIPDHLTCLLRNLYVGQEARVRTGHGARGWFKSGKGVHQGCILSPFLFNFYEGYIMWNARLDESQTGIKIAGEITTSDMPIISLMAESKEELKSLWWGKRGEWKSWLKTQHSKN